MYRVIKASTEIRTFQNRQNPNKFVEVKKSNDGHSYMRQYMQWDTDNGTVKNYTGAKDAKRGRYSRATQQTINQVLEDYDEIDTINSASDINDQIYYIDGERNYEGEHSFVIRRNDGQTIDNIGEVNDLIQATGYDATLFPTGCIWLHAPAEDIDIVEQMLP